MSSHLSYAAKKREDRRAARREQGLPPAGRRRRRAARRYDPEQARRDLERLQLGRKGGAAAQEKGATGRGSPQLRCA